MSRDLSLISFTATIPERNNVIALKQRFRREKQWKYSKRSVFDFDSIPYFFSYYLLAIFTCEKPCLAIFQIIWKMLLAVLVGGEESTEVLLLQLFEMCLRQTFKVRKDQSWEKITFISVLLSCSSKLIAVETWPSTLSCLTSAHPANYVSAKLLSTQQLTKIYS